jgi:hypothetical protein
MSAQEVPVIADLNAKDITEDQLALLNAHLNLLPPSEVLRWGIEHLPNLYQTTAFGLTGLVGIDMLSKLTPSPPPLIFLDTLYHFKETLDLVENVRSRYGIQISVYKPNGCDTADEFEKMYGEKLWEVSEEIYDYAIKVCNLLFFRLYGSGFSLGSGCFRSRLKRPPLHLWITSSFRRGFRISESLTYLDRSSQQLERTKN